MGTSRLKVLNQAPDLPPFPAVSPDALRLAPTAIRLEAVAACQLQCPSCPTADGSIRPAIASGYLRFERFKQLIDANPTLRSIELSNYGEIFLNPQIVEIMRYAHERGVTLSAENGVNLNTVEPEALEALVKYRVRAITCSIDGASAKTYSVYRVKGAFDTVMANLRKIVEYKRQYDSRYPELTWQFIVFGHNEHEIAAARAMAERLGMVFRPKISWDEDFSPIRDRAHVMREAGISATRGEHKETTGVDYSRSICHQLWRDPQVNWDGKILGCCRNFWGDFGGNAFEDGLGEALNNPKIAYAREMLMGNLPARSDVPCTTCDLYLAMQAEKSFIRAPELEKPRISWARLYRFLERRPRLFRTLRALYRSSGAKRVVSRFSNRTR